MHAPKLKFFNTISAVLAYMTSELAATLEDDAQEDPSEAKDLRKKIADIETAGPILENALRQARPPLKFERFKADPRWDHFSGPSKQHPSDMPDGTPAQIAPTQKWHYIIDGTGNPKGKYNLTIWEAESGEWFFSKHFTTRAFAEFVANAITDEHLDNEKTMYELGFLYREAGADY